MAVRLRPESRMVEEWEGMPFWLDSHPPVAIFSYTRPVLLLAENNTHSVGFARASAKSRRPW
jgi:hypothetical protein